MATELPHYIAFGVGDQRFTAITFPFNTEGPIWYCTQVLRGKHVIASPAHVWMRSKPVKYLVVKHYNKLLELYYGGSNLRDAKRISKHESNSYIIVCEQLPETPDYT